MSLDKQLRAMLSDEGDSRVAPDPDLDRLIGGGRALRRRRRLARATSAAAAVVLVGAAAYGLGQVDVSGSDAKPEIADQSPTATMPFGRDRIEPGTHPFFVGLDSGGERIEADMTLNGSGWFAGDQPLLFDGRNAAGAGVYEPEQVASASGCSGDWRGRKAARTPRGLARQLSKLPLGTVLQPPTPVEVLGREAVHLSMRIGFECPGNDHYSVVQAATGERGITYTLVAMDVVIDFWVFDQDGTTVVADAWHDVGSSQDMAERANLARNSITFLSTE